MARTIIHLDLDAFYASVEVLDDPSLAGRPVIVGGTRGRGVVAAASYEARRFGVHSAMPTARARRLCPEGVFLPPRFERYGELSRQVFEIYRRYTPLVEPLSLDEAFLDVTESQALHGTGRDIAVAVKRAVRGETGLTVSAGVAEVKMAAKIASDLGKPDGLTVVPEGGVAAFLAPLPVGRLWGVGAVTERALRKLGVSTIGELARLPEAVLSERFGAHGRHMHALARGEDPRTVVPDEAAKSIGAEDTFEQDLSGAEALWPRILDQVERVARRLRAAGERGRTVTLKLKYSDFTLVTRRCTLSHPTDDAGAIAEAIRLDLSRADLSRPVRLTGVAVSGFEEAGGAPSGQLGLFEPPAAARDGRRQRLNAALDAIAGRHGEDAVRPATLLGRPEPAPQGPRGRRGGAH
ncbi:MAG TPA: DNA polymerase IV [Anaeromyxobacteraceae bacterium]|nr:DNA polymerase IV [Anaeromyxobacteraceae bacterium]